MQAIFTKHHYAQLPEGFPAQLVEGRLVRRTTPPYGHQVLVGRILEVLGDALEGGCLLPGPVDVPIDELNVYQPDAAVYATSPPLGESGTKMPRVVFEVLEPRTAALDRDPKLLRYLAAGVVEVWLLDPAAGTIEIHATHGGRRARGGETAHSSRVPGLALVPNEMFGQAAD